MPFWTFCVNIVGWRFIIEEDLYYASAQKGFSDVFLSYDMLQEFCQAQPEKAHHRKPRQLSKHELFLRLIRGCTSFKFTSFLYENHGMGFSSLPSTVDSGSET